MRKSCCFFAVIILISAQLSGQTMEQDSLILVDLYQQTNGAEWTDNTNWLNEPVATWFGITVVADRVRRVDLSNNNLTGTIPASLGGLELLEYLNLGINQISGQIPAELGNLVYLKTLHLYNNQLTDSIPASLGNLINLVELNLGNNQLKGAIPATLGKLKNLQVLWIDTNGLTGTIPIELGKLTNLIDMSLANNQLQGTIPAEIGSLVNLEYLNLSYNQLSGSIPHQLGQLTSLRKIEFESNRLSGELPAELGNLGNLETLFLFANQLSGSVPYNFRNLNSLQRLWIQGNQLVDLPDLSAIPDLVEFKIEKNRFTFEDIEPNLGVAFFFSYSPQDSIGSYCDTTITEGKKFTLSVSVGGEHNRYQWKKDGMPIWGATGREFTIPRLSLSDSGSYHCEITNTVATSLTLISRPTRLHVREGVWIYPACPLIAIAGDSFWVEVNIGTELRPVKDLFGVSFALHFDSTFAGIVEPDSESIIPGTFLGDTSQVLFLSRVQNDSVNIGISRVLGDGSVSGYGNLVRLKFTTATKTPENTKINFSISSVVALDAKGDTLELVPQDTAITIKQPRVKVWPGDTNNDGIVNQADVLPIGLSMGLTGPARPNATIDWIGQLCMVWDPVRATYADASGNGVVADADMYVIGVNWGKTVSRKKKGYRMMAERSDNLPRQSNSPQLEKKITTALTPPLYPYVDSTTQRAGDEFWVDVKVGTGAEPVNDLFGISFVLRYDGAHCDVVPPYKAHVIPGDFLGDSSEVIFFSPELPGDSINVGISRGGSDTNISGTGTVARVKFFTPADTPDSTRIHFRIESIFANDASGNPIELAPGDVWITIVQDRLIVWPGDTNNDGIVNQVDVLPLGLYWNLTGPARDYASQNWSGQSCLVWKPAGATFADASGDGVVNESDVLPIGLNWGAAHGLHRTIPALNLSETTGAIRPMIHLPQKGDREFFIDIRVEDGDDLFGIALELKYDPAKMTLVSLQSGESWSPDRLFYQTHNQSDGVVAVALSQKAGQPALNKNFSVIRLSAKSTQDQLSDITSLVAISSAIATSPDGESYSLRIEEAALQNGLMEIPERFRLHQNYPNPFNAATQIRYALRRNCSVRISIYNLLGQKIRELVNAEQEAGIYLVNWDGRDDSGDGMPSGIYLIKMKAGEFVTIRKMILAR